MRMYGQKRRYGAPSEATPPRRGIDVDARAGTAPTGRENFDSLRARLGHFDRPGPRDAVSSSSLVSSGSTLARSDDVAFLMHSLHAPDIDAAASAVRDLASCIADPRQREALHRHGAVDKALDRLADAVQEDNGRMDAALVLLLRVELDPGTTEGSSSHRHVMLGRYLDPIVTLVCRVVLRRALRADALPYHARAEACKLAEACALGGGRGAQPSTSSPMMKRSASTGARQEGSSKPSPLRRRRSPMTKASTWQGRASGRAASPGLGAPRSIESWSQLPPRGEATMAAECATILRAFAAGVHSGAVGLLGGRQGGPSHAEGAGAPAEEGWLSMEGAPSSRRVVKRVRRRDRGKGRPAAAAEGSEAAPSNGGSGGAKGEGSGDKVGEGEGGEEDADEVAWAAIEILATLVDPEDTEGPAATLSEVEAGGAGHARAVMGSARSRARTASAAKPRVADCGGLLAVAAMLCRAASRFGAHPADGTAARRLASSARVVELCTHDAARARDQLLRCFPAEGNEAAVKGAFLADNLAKASAAALGAAVDLLSTVGLQPLSSVLRVWLNLTHRCERGVDALLRVPALLQQVVRAVVELYLLYDADASKGAAAQGEDQARQVPACDALQYALGVLTNAVESSEAPLARLAAMTVAVPSPLAWRIGADGGQAGSGDPSCSVDLRGPADGKACSVPGSTLLALLCAHHMHASGLAAPDTGDAGLKQQLAGAASGGEAEGDSAAAEDAEVRPDQVVVAAYFAVLVGCLLDRGAGCHATAGAALVRRLKYQPVAPDGAGAAELPPRGSQQEAEQGSGPRRALSHRLAAALGESTATVVSVLGQIARVLRAFVGMQSSAGVLTVEGARDVGRLIQRFEGTASNELLDSVRKLAQQQGREEAALLGDEPGVDTSVPTPVKRGPTTPQKQAMHVSPAGDGACELTGQRLLSSAEVSRAALAVGGGVVGGGGGDARGDVGRRSHVPSRTSSSGQQQGAPPSWLQGPASAAPNSARALNGRGSSWRSPARSSSQHVATPPSWSTPESRASARKRRQRPTGASTELADDDDEDEDKAGGGAAAAAAEGAAAPVKPTDPRLSPSRTRSGGSASSGAASVFAAPRRKLRKYGAVPAAPVLDTSGSDE